MAKGIVHADKNQNNSHFDCDMQFRVNFSPRRSFTWWCCFVDQI